ncbi:hypothetical protein DNTS_027424 [Danionella cerebrum]|uniref:Uncharacterized protein n=1 Tax=Danionella cerebrum TaxID=2873325 RepID=A0A553Q474_9TELE|nr:hypothetical protein DNTS_027424 [Danionella translucida]
MIRALGFPQRTLTIFSQNFFSGLFCIDGNVCSLSRKQIKLSQHGSYLLVFPVCFQVQKTTLLSKHLIHSDLQGKADHEHSQRPRLSAGSERVLSEHLS